MATSVECRIEALILVIVGMAADGRCTHLSGAARWFSISAVALDIPPVLLSAIASYAFVVRRLSDLWSSWT